jgi:hypothetical protein
MPRPAEGGEAHRAAAVVVGPCCEEGKMMEDAAASAPAISHPSSRRLLVRPARERHRHQLQWVHRHQLRRVRGGEFVLKNMAEDWAESVEARVGTVGGNLPQMLEKIFVRPLVSLLRSWGAPRRNPWRRWRLGPRKRGAVSK